MNPTVILMELQAAAARIMRAPLKEQQVTAAIDQEVVESMPHIYRVSGARRQGRGGRRPVFQLQSSSKCEV